MNLRGYRDADRPLLSGHWLPGELLGLPLADRPALAEPVSVAPPTDHRDELCVVAGVGFVRYAELDWVHRRARLEIGITVEQPGALEPLVKSALTHGFRVLNLHRLHGWVTPATRPRTDVLTGVGLRHEATVPAAGWLAGTAVDREVWGAVRDD